jgi:hypothetical protein
VCGPNVLTALDTGGYAPAGLCQFRHRHERQARLGYLLSGELVNQMRERRAEVGAGELRDQVRPAVRPLARQPDYHNDGLCTCHSGSQRQAAARFARAVQEPKR